MVIGCLCDIPFLVSEDVVRTLDNMTWSGSAQYAIHKRHLTNALTEFVSPDPDNITFDIVLSTDLGTDPNNEVVNIWNYERSGEAVALTIGTKGYGKYRWNITSHKMKIVAVCHRQWHDRLRLQNLSKVKFAPPKRRRHFSLSARPKITNVWGFERAMLPRCALVRSGQTEKNRHIWGAIYTILTLNYCVVYSQK